MPSAAGCNCKSGSSSAIKPLDTAGAYGIQGRGALFIAHLDGDYFNVMGLPLCRLGQLLNDLGVELL